MEVKVFKKCSFYKKSVKKS